MFECGLFLIVRNQAQQQQQSEDKYTEWYDEATLGLISLYPTVDSFSLSVTVMSSNYTLSHAP